MHLFTSHKHYLQNYSPHKTVSSYMRILNVDAEIGLSPANEHAASKVPAALTHVLNMAHIELKLTMSASECLTRESSPSSP